MLSLKVNLIEGKRNLITCMKILMVIKMKMLIMVKMLVHDGLSSPTDDSYQEWKLKLKEWFWWWKFKWVIIGVCYSEGDGDKEKVYESDSDTSVRIHRRSCHNAPDEINPNTSISVSPVDETGKITLCRWKIWLSSALWTNFDRLLFPRRIWT